MDPVSLAIKGRIKCCEHHNLLNIGQNFGTSPQAVWQVRNCIESMSQAPKLFLRSVTDHVWGDLPLNTKHSVVSFSLLGISSTLHCTAALVHWSLYTGALVPWDEYRDRTPVTAPSVKQSFLGVSVGQCCLSDSFSLCQRRRQRQRQRQPQYASMSKGLSLKSWYYWCCLRPLKYYVSYVLMSHELAQRQHLPLRRIFLFLTKTEFQVCCYHTVEFEDQALFWNYKTLTMLLYIVFSLACLIQCVFQLLL